MLLSPGLYFIGDPCYVIDESLWDEFCNVLDKIEKENGYLGGIVEFKGARLFVATTMYGDGSYIEEHTNKTIGVDSGLIGAIPLDKGITHDAVDIESLGIVTEFKTDFECYEEDGVFHIGDFVIPTFDLDYLDEYADYDEDLYDEEDDIYADYEDEEDDFYGDYEDD